MQILLSHAYLLGFSKQKLMSIAKGVMFMTYL